MYEQMINKKRIKLKLERSRLIGHYIKIMLILHMKAVDRILMIKGRLRSIDL